MLNNIRAFFELVSVIGVLGYGFKLQTEVIRDMKEMKATRDEWLNRKLASDSINKVWERNNKK